MMIHESFQSFLNEEEKKQSEALVLFKVTFKEDFKIQATEGPNKGEWKSLSSKWVLITNRQAVALKQQPAIDSIKAAHEFKDKDSANAWLKQKGEKEGSEIKGSVTELEDVFKIMKTMVKKSEKKTAEERAKEKEKTEKEKEKKDEHNTYLGMPGALAESKVSDYIMELLEKWYQNPRNKNVLKKLMDATGIDNSKKLEDVLKRNTDAYTAFNSLMQVESFATNLYEISGDWLGGTLRFAGGFTFNQSGNDNTMPKTYETKKSLGRGKWDKMSHEQRLSAINKVTKDEAEANEFAKTDWDKLPGWLTDNLWECKIWESSDIINRDAAIKDAEKLGIVIGQKYHAVTKEYGRVDVVVKDIYYWRPTGKLWVNTNQLINKKEVPATEEGQIIFTDMKDLEKFKEIKE